MSERLSTCCGAKPWGEFDWKPDRNEIGESGICSRCKDHAEFLSEEEMENQEKLARLVQKWEAQEKLEITD